MYKRQAITCNVANSLLGKDSFQEIDITGVTMPITKYNFIVKDINKLAKVIRRAFVIAQSGRDVYKRQVMNEISKKGLLNLDCMTVTGKTVGENIKDCVNKDPDVIRPIDNPCSPDLTGLSC